MSYSSESAGVQGPAMETGGQTCRGRQTLGVVLRSNFAVFGAKRIVVSDAEA